MDRHEFPISGEAERWVEAIERGDEVVLTRDGKIVAEVRAAPTQAEVNAARLGKIDWEAIRRLQDSVPEELRGQGAAMIRELRESYRY